jgi:hypothetical protein
VRPRDRRRGGERHAIVPSRPCRADRRGGDARPRGPRARRAARRRRRSADPQGRHRPDLLGPESLAVGLRPRLRGLHPQLRPARRVRPEPRQRPRLRRVVDDIARRPDHDLQDPVRDEVVRRRAGHLRGCGVHVQARPRRDHEGGHPRVGLHRWLPVVGRSEGSLRARSDDLRRHDRNADCAPPPGLRSDPPEAHLVEVHPRADRQRGGRGRVPQRRPGRRDRPVHRRRIQAQGVHALRPQQELLGQAGRGRRGDPPALRERRHDGPEPQERRDRLRPGHQRRRVRCAQDLE